MRGEPNPNQWEMYAKNDCVFHHHAAALLPVHAQLEQGLSRMVAAQRHPRYAEPILIQLYSEVLQNFRLAAQGKSITAPAAGAFARSASRPIFDPLPFCYEPLEDADHAT